MAVFEAIQQMRSCESSTKCIYFTENSNISNDKFAEVMHDMLIQRTRIAWLTPISTHNVRVLIADDGKTNRLSLAMRLKRVHSSWDIDCVSSAEGAVLTHLSYDVLILDEEFGEGMMTGYAAIDIIRSQEAMHSVPSTRKAVIASWSASTLGENRAADFLWEKEISAADISQNLNIALNVRAAT